MGLNLMHFCYLADCWKDSWCNPLIGFSCSQGDRGSIGAPGQAGDIGIGFPGAKVLRLTLLSLKKSIKVIHFTMT